MKPSAVSCAGRTAPRAYSEPKTVEVLRYLTGQAGRVVPREELMAAVWPDVFVTDDSITQCVGEIRRALGDEGAGLLLTLPKRGYMLDLQAAALDGEPPRLAGLPGQQQRSALGVLPFANLSGDPAQDYFADGIMEELTTALARVRWFSVVGRPSTLPYKGQSADVRLIGRELGVRYLLDGSVRQVAGRVRIACKLLETDAGHQVWAERFEGGLEDIFALQDRVAEAVAAAVEPSLERAEIERVRHRPTASLGAYDLYLRALPSHFLRTEAGCADAIVLLRRAVALDASFSLAKALLVGCLTQRVEQGWAGSGDREEGIRLAHELLATNGADPLVLICVMYAVGLLARDTAAAFDIARRLLKLHPNSALVQGAAGLAYAWEGDSVASETHFRRAIELNPCDPDFAFWTTGLARAALMEGRPEAAVPLAEQAIAHLPACVPAYRLLIASLWYLDRRNEAFAAVKRMQAASPGAARFSADAFRCMYRDQDFAEKLIKAWREAGLPEDERVRSRASAISPR